MCFAWVIGEFRAIQHHTPLTKQTISSLLKSGKKKLAIYSTEQL